MLKGNYYVASFFWSTLQKVLSAVLGFVSVPLLLGYYGKADYGIIALASACNGYMHLLDLGMNTGAVKFFSQWRAEGKTDLINRVARTNISFYLIISLINALMLVALALFGEGLFSVSHEQFLQLRSCLFIIALFSVLSWGTTTFSQLLVADMRITFTVQLQSVQVVLKFLLIVLVISMNLTLSTYFFWLTAIVASLLVPYAIKCRKEGLIDSLRPAAYWGDFKTVLTFSLSIFALSVFHMTATQSRAILLGVFSNNAAEVVSEFRIIEVVPQLIIMIGGTLTSIFLPKTSDMVARNNRAEIEQFAYKWTTLTSVITNMLCMPFVCCASEVLTAYVGADYAPLSKWMIIWIFTVLVQIHTTPGNALFLAYGRTKPLVIAWAIACVVSILVNAALCKYFGVGSAVIGFFVYILIEIGVNYVWFYRTILNLSRRRMLACFLIPTVIALAWLYAVRFIPLNIEWFAALGERWSNIALGVIKALIWAVPYVGLLFALGGVRLEMFKK